MEGDVVTALLASVGTVLLGAQLQVAVAAALGDPVARRPRVLWDVRRRIDRTGTLIVPGLVALAAGVAVGWSTRPPLGGEELSRPRRAVVGLTPAVTALLVAVVALLIDGPGAAAGAAGTGVVATTGSTVATVALLQAGLWLLPAPPLPAGAVVGALLDGDRAARWERRARGPVAPWGLAAGAVVVLTDAGAALHAGIVG